MNILLINPPTPLENNESPAILPPLGLLYVAAALESAGHTVLVHDHMLHSTRTRGQKTVASKPNHSSVHEDHLKTLIKKNGCQVVGISCMFAVSEMTVIAIADIVKSADKTITVVAGGSNASVRYRELMSSHSIDATIIGEAEEAFVKLLGSIQAKTPLAELRGIAYRENGVIKINEGLNIVKNLDQLPLPAYHLLDTPVEAYFHVELAGTFVTKRILPICTSRGCVKNCIFCMGAKHFGHWRGRDPESVVAEITSLVDRFNIQEVAFTDSNININVARFKHLLELMKKMRHKIFWTAWGGLFIETFDESCVPLMNETGCTFVFLSPEHGDLAIQKFIGKITPAEKMKKVVDVLRKNDIWTHGNFVIGLPGEDPVSLKHCFEYARTSDFDGVSFHIAIPVPGSKLYDILSNRYELKEENLRFKTKSADWSSFKPGELIGFSRKFLIQYALTRALHLFHPSFMWGLLKHKRKNRLKMFLVNVKSFVLIVLRLFVQ